MVQKSIKVLLQQLGVLMRYLRVRASYLQRTFNTLN